MVQDGRVQQLKNWTTKEAFKLHALPGKIMNCLMIGIYGLIVSIGCTLGEGELGKHVFFFHVTIYCKLQKQESVFQDKSGCRMDHY